MNIPNFFRQCLIAYYDSAEIDALYRIVVAHVCQIDYLQAKLFSGQFSEQQYQKIHIILGQLQQAIPIQYILNEAPFMGMNLYVNEHTLIPRPETEELVDWLLQDYSSQYAAATSIIDFGTGSGCIALAIKRHLKSHRVIGVDKSENALQVAKKNADLQGLDMIWMLDDILDIKMEEEVEVIISNPPYIHRQESVLMQQHVLKHEPHSALFVDHNDPIIFYTKIIDYAVQFLQLGGHIYFEINPIYQKDIAIYLEQKNFQNIELKLDMQGNARMLKAQKL